jgi:hypothetical protein
MIQKGQLICTFTVTLTIYIDNNSLKSMKLTYLKIFNNILRTAVRFKSFFSKILKYDKIPEL